MERPLADGATLRLRSDGPLIRRLGSRLVRLSIITVIIGAGSALALIGGSILLGAVGVAITVFNAVMLLMTVAILVRSGSIDAGPQLIVQARFLGGRKRLEGARLDQAGIAFLRRPRGAAPSLLFFTLDDTGRRTFSFGTPAWKQDDVTAMAATVGLRTSSWEGVVDWKTIGERFPLAPPLAVRKPIVRFIPLIVAGVLFVGILAAFVVYIVTVVAR